MDTTSCIIGLSWKALLQPPLSKTPPEDPRPAQTEDTPTVSTQARPPRSRPTKRASFLPPAFTNSISKKKRTLLCRPSCRLKVILRSKTQARLQTPPTASTTRSRPCTSLPPIQTMRTLTRPSWQAVRPIENGCCKCCSAGNNWQSCILRRRATPQP